AVASLVDLRRVAIITHGRLSALHDDQLDPLDVAEHLLSRRLPAEYSMRSAAAEEHLRMLIDRELSIGRVADAAPNQTDGLIYSVFVLPLLLPLLGPLLIASTDTDVHQAWLNLINHTVERA